jgi:transposase
VKGGLLPEKIGLPRSVQKKQAAHVSYHRIHQSRGLLDWQKGFNKQINKTRYVIEQVIANLKAWRIMHTDYRRPPATFPETISAVGSSSWLGWYGG